MSGCPSAPVNNKTPAISPDRFRLTLLWLVVIGSPSLLTCYYWIQHPTLLGPDQALLIDIARSFLDGKHLYAQIREINPPLIIYLSAIPALIGTITHLTPTLSLVVFVFSVALITVCLAKAVSQCLPKEQRHYVLSLLLAQTLCLKANAVDFGQREQLFSLAYLPFLLLRYARWNGRPLPTILAVVCGIFAAIGICLKPYFLLMVAAPELIYILQNKKLKPMLAPEVLAAASVTLLYLLHLLFLPKDSLETYFQTILPLVKHGYEYYTVSAMNTLNACKPELYELVAVTVTAILLRRFNSLLEPLLAFTIVGLPVYLLAGQNWSYHLMPMRIGILSLAAVECTTVLLLVRRSIGQTRFDLDGITTYALIAFFMGWLANGLYSTYFQILSTANQAVSPWGDASNAEDKDWIQLLSDYTRKGDPVLFITRGVFPAYPATLQMERKAGSRFPQAMPLLMAKYLALDLIWSQSQAYKKLLDRIIGEYGQDIHENRPKLIVIQKSEVDELLNTYNFHQKYMSNYHKLEDYDDFLIYTLSSQPQ